MHDAKIIRSIGEHPPILAEGRRTPDRREVSLRWLSGAEAKAMEPEVRCEIALLSPETGVVYSHALMLSLLGECEAAGGSLTPR